MPITYRIFTHADMTYAAWTGMVTSDEIIANFQRYVADPVYRAGRTELIDLSASDESDVRFPDLARLLGRVNAQVFHKNAATLTSVYAPGEMAWGLSRMYETMASLRSGIDVILARTEAAALEPLGRPEKTIAAFLDALEREEANAPSLPDAEAV